MFLGFIHISIRFKSSVVGSVQSYFLELLLWTNSLVKVLV
nr:MAG TPA: hypothetical protein [Caudoviricetes sp.]